MCDSPRELILQVLNKIQDFDPPGIAARDLRECLLKQTESLQIKNPVVIRIIKDHLKNLEIKSYKAISRSLKVSVEVVAKDGSVSELKAANIIVATGASALVPPAWKVDGEVPNSWASSIRDSQVMGCQLAVWFVVSAHLMPSDVRGF